MRVIEVRRVNTISIIMVTNEASIMTLILIAHKRIH